MNTFLVTALAVTGILAIFFLLLIVVALVEFYAGLLLLDEPLGPLDLKLRQELQLEIKRIHERVAPDSAPAPGPYSVTDGGLPNVGRPRGPGHAECTQDRAQRALDSAACRAEAALAQEIKPAAMLPPDGADRIP